MMAHESKDSRLHIWCKEGNYEKVKEFVSTCDDFPARLTYRRGSSGFTPIHEAVDKGYAKVLELLLRHKGDVNCRANNRCTPLHLAASHGNVDCVRVLLLHNADISATDESGRSPIQVAESSSKHTVVKVLRSAGITKCVCIRRRLCMFPWYIMLLKSSKKLHAFYLLHNYTSECMRVIPQ